MTREQDPHVRQPLPRAGLDIREREALASFLQSPAMGGRAMDLHMIQGLAAGLCLGPRLISPALWLPWVWDHEHGAQAPTFADIDQFNTVAGWVMALYNETAEQLGPAADEDGRSYAPLFAGLADGAQTAVASYCVGLRRAIALASDNGNHYGPSGLSGTT